MQSTKTRPRADCGSDHELLIAKFRLKLKKAGKTTKPFRYNLNQILLTLLVRIQTSTATMENSVEIPLKIANRTAL